MSIILHKDNQAQGQGQDQQCKEESELINEVKERMKITKVKYSSTLAVNKVSPCVVIENKHNKGVIVPKVKMTLEQIKAIDVNAIQNEPKSQYENANIEVHKQSIDDVDNMHGEEVIDPKGDVRNTQADRINLFKGFKYTKDPLGGFIKDSNDDDDQEEDEDEEINHKSYQLKLIPLEQRLIDMFDLNIK